MKIRGAVLNAMGVEPPYTKTRPLSIDEIELQPPGRGEVLVKMRAAGLCHSDLSVINGDRPRPTPMLLGHEAAGTVESVGDGVDDLAQGDHVVLVFVPSCGHCSPCAEGRPALCVPGAVSNGAGTLLGGHRRLFRGGDAINHHMGCSAFAEYAVVSRHSLVKVDRDLPFDEAAVFGCAVLTGVGAVVNTARVPAGATVAIVDWAAWDWRRCWAPWPPARAASSRWISRGTSAILRRSSVRPIRSTRPWRESSKRSSRRPRGAWSSRSSSRAR
jgi:alcohol dehydrogenase